MERTTAHILQKDIPARAGSSVRRQSGTALTEEQAGGRVPLPTAHKTLTQEQNLPQHRKQQTEDMRVGHKLAGGMRVKAEAAARPSWQSRGLSTARKV